MCSNAIAINKRCNDDDDHNNNSNQYDDNDFVILHEYNNWLLSQEFFRLKTFSECDKKCSSRLYPHLAKAGFYFDFLKNVIECLECGFLFDINNNNSLDNYRDIINHHGQNSPSCLFVKERKKIDIKKVKRRKIFNCPYRSLRYERERLDTFIEWPLYYSSVLSPEKLAAEGFYYLRTSDVCVCIFCHGGIEEWDINRDTARNQHQLHFPHCPFLQGKPVGNISLAESCILDKLPLSGQAPLMLMDDDKNIIEGVRQHSAKFKAYVFESTRLESFKNKWPNRVNYITPESLASAGFFYNGPSDHVRCYHCGYGLRNWEMGDIPLELHALWYPTCGFILGKEIEKIIESEKLKKERRKKNIKGGGGGGENNNFRSIAAKKIKTTNTQRFNSPTCDDLEKLLITSDILKYVQNMGYPKYAVEVALKQKLEKTGLPFFSVEECVKSVKEKQKEIENDEALESIRENNKVIPNGIIQGKHLYLINHSFQLEETEKIYQCKICMDARIEIVILPCLHMCCCRDCIKLLKECPICRNEISYIVNPIIC